MQHQHHASDDSLEGGGDTRSYGSAMVPLPDSFSPGEYDVIVGRGKAARNWPGNATFRDLVAARLDEYSAATSKLEKSAIVTAVLYHVRNKSPKGGFIKKDPLTGQWYEVGDFVARERVTQCFRDELHGKYRSSNSSKKKRRKEELKKAKETPSIKKRKAVSDQQKMRMEESEAQVHVQPSMPSLPDLLPPSITASSPTADTVSFFNQPLHSGHFFGLPAQTMSSSSMPSLSGQPTDNVAARLPQLGQHLDQEILYFQQQAQCIAGVLPQNSLIQGVSYPNSWFRVNSQECKPPSSMDDFAASITQVPGISTASSSITTQEFAPAHQFEPQQMNTASSLTSAMQTLNYGGYAQDDNPFEPVPIAENISRRHSQNRGMGRQGYRME